MTTFIFYCVMTILKMICQVTCLFLQSQYWHRRIRPWYCLKTCQSNMHGEENNNFHSTGDKLYTY